MQVSKSSLTLLRHFLVALLVFVARNSFAQDGGAPPPGLRCLAQHYAVSPRMTERGWVGAFADGGVLAWNDRRMKTEEQRLDAPDLSDIFADRYEAGALRAPTNDSGRVRVDALFKATYGSDAKQVDAAPFTFFGQKLLVHRRVLPAFEQVRTELQVLVKTQPAVAAFLENAGGTFVWRNIAGTERLSAHSFGVSIDLDVKRANYWRWDKKPSYRNQYPELVHVFEKHGFIWGGRWVHYDTMHFEFRPELLDASCYGAEGSSAN